MATQEMELVLTGIGIVGGTVGIVKLMLMSMLKGIKQHCTDQQLACTQWKGNSKEDRNNLWERFNKHSHKGLGSDDGKVVIND